MGIENNILQTSANGLGNPALIAAIIGSSITAAAGITVAAINARTQKKNNQAAKELAELQAQLQQQQLQNYANNYTQTSGTSTETASNSNDNLLMYAVLALGLVLLLKR